MLLKQPIVIEPAAPRARWVLASPALSVIWPVFQKCRRNAR